jgi:RNase H
MLIAGLTDWISNWNRNGWKNSKGDPVLNQEIIRYISGCLRLRGMNKQKVLFEHVKGHSGEEGNEAADALANEGAALPAVDDRDWVALLRELEKFDGSKQPPVIAPPATPPKSLLPAPTISPHLTGKDKSKVPPVIVTTDTNSNIGGKMKRSYEMILNPDEIVEGFHWEGSKVVVTVSSTNGNPLPVKVTPVVDSPPSSSQPIGSSYIVAGSVRPDEVDFSVSDHY